jgi:hypothetical protein
MATVAYDIPPALVQSFRNRSKGFAIGTDTPAPSRGLTYEKKSFPVSFPASLVSRFGDQMPNDIYSRFVAPPAR